jgi:ParB-like chromosome segregation protein Spo0J
MNGKHRPPVLRTVMMDRIDTADRSFCLSWHLSDRRLAESIALCGLINPPLLISKKGGSYAIVCGFKRITSCKELGFKSVPAFVCKDQPDPLRCLFMSFWDNLPHRRFNPVEKALILQRFAPCLDEQRIISEILPLLQLHAHTREFKRYLRIGELPHEAKEALAKDELALDAALLLLDFEASARISLLQFIVELRLTVSRQKEVLELIHEICRREGVSPLEIITDQAVREISSRKELSQPQKSFYVHQWLRKRRYPQLSERESNFAAWLKELHLESNISIQPPPYFEGKTRSVRFAVSSHQEMGQVLEKLFSLYREGKLKPLFDDSYGL